ESARVAGLDLVTTEKDAVRLANGMAPESFVARLKVLAIAAEFDLPHAAEAILEETQARFRRRRGF
ncbi:MAG: tetraacyldisaccharide 4'-kinase, partial [Rhizobiaceae bacterium]|nr:tetraacyldisaccharide 4'-kinase [Rhizobiaceae bacterium]